MKKAGEVLESLFKDRFGTRFVEKARSAAGLFSSWIQIASEAWPPSGERESGDIPPAAAHSRIREFEKGILLVEADHPGMVQLLQIKQQALLDISRRRFPELEIRGISFCLSRDPFSFSAVGVSSSPSKSEKTETEPAAEAEVIPEPEKSGEKTGNENDSYYSALKRLGESIKKSKGKR